MTALQALPARPLPEGTAAGPPRGSFFKLEGTGLGEAARLRSPRQRAPKLVLQVQRPLLPRSSPPPRALEGGNPSRAQLEGGLPISLANLGALLHRSHLGRGVPGGR